MIQDWKVGHILGGTPWRMQIGGLIGVVAAALTLTFSLQLLHNNIGIGSETLPAPQAGLMAAMATAIGTRTTTITSGVENSLKASTKVVRRC